MTTQTAVASTPSSSSKPDRELLERVLGHIRITSDAKFAADGTCLMTRVNEFDSLGKAGIQNGDEILMVDGAPMGGFNTFLHTIERLGVGSKPIFRIRRAGVEIDIPVELLKKRKLNFDIEEAQSDLERRIAPADE
jgi:S1-C subfamily serine protease